MDMLSEFEDMWSGHLGQDRCYEASYVAEARCEADLPSTLPSRTHPAREVEEGNRLHAARGSH